MKEDAWHYPRENLAARTFNALVEGPAKALTLLKPKLKLSAPIGGARAQAEIDLSSLKGEPPAELIKIGIYRTMVKADRHSTRHSSPTCTWC